MQDNPKEYSVIVLTTVNLCICGERLKSSIIPQIRYGKSRVLQDSHTLWLTLPNIIPIRFPPQRLFSFDIKRELNKTKNTPTISVISRAFERIFKDSTPRYNYYNNVLFLSGIKSGQINFFVRKYTSCIFLYFQKNVENYVESVKHKLNTPPKYPEY